MLYVLVSLEPFNITWSEFWHSRASSNCAGLVPVCFVHITKLYFCARKCKFSNDWTFIPHIFLIGWMWQLSSDLFVSVFEIKIFLPRWVELKWIEPGSAVMCFYSRRWYFCWGELSRSGRWLASEAASNASRGGPLCCSSWAWYCLRPLSPCHQCLQHHQHLTKVRHYTKHKHIPL